MLTSTPQVSIGLYRFDQTIGWTYISKSNAITMAAIIATAVATGSTHCEPVRAASAEQPDKNFKAFGFSESMHWTECFHSSETSVPLDCLCMLAARQAH